MTQEVVSDITASDPDPAELRVEIARSAPRRQYLVAEKVGLSESQLSRILSGRAPLTRDLDKQIRQAIAEVAAS